MITQGTQLFLVGDLVDLTLWGGGGKQSEAGMRKIREWDAGGELEGEKEEKEEMERYMEKWKENKDEQLNSL